MSKLKTNRSVILVGGPDAGKTNYLGRLWLALDAEEGAIVKNGLPPQIEYLRAVGQALNSGHFAGRSAPGTFESSAIPIKWNQGGLAGQLIVPDCAGEQWVKIHTEREWNTDWESAMSSMVGCILFFRVDSAHNESPLDWSNHAELMRFLQSARESEEGAQKLPTQVLLVDWLHCLCTAYREIQRTDVPLRVAIALSAWDMAPNEYRNADPDKYLSDQIPLLKDFLMGNPNLFNAKAFGVSSTGGVLTDGETQFMKEYLEREPNKNGYVVLTKGDKVILSKDLTLPLAWAIDCNCAEFGQDVTSAS